MLRKAIAGIAFLVVAVFASAWFVDFDATELGGAALRQSSASLGIQLDASRYRINLLRGLEIENVEASARAPGVRYTIAMQRMRLRHRVSSLLWGRVEVERVIVDRPRVVIVTGFEPEPEPSLSSPAGGERRRSRDRRVAAPDTSPNASPVELQIRELELVDAAFSFNDELSVEGVDVSLLSPTLEPGALTLLHAVDATGALSLREVSFRSLTVRDVEATLAMTGGRVELTDGAFATEAGAFRVGMSLDLNSIPARYQLTLSGGIDGVPGTVRFEGEGFGTDAAKLSGDGVWTVPSGHFDDAPLWRILGLTDSAYEATELAFQVDDARLAIDGLWIRGKVGFDGELDLIVSGKAVGGTWGAPELR